MMISKPNRKKPKMLEIEQKLEQMKVLDGYRKTENKKEYLREQTRKARNNLNQSKNELEKKKYYYKLNYIKRLPT